MNLLEAERIFSWTVLPALRSRPQVLFLALFLALLFPAQAGAQGPTEEQIAFFERNVRPVFVEQCAQCHGDKVQMASLQLTTESGFMKGSDSGPIVVEGAPQSSRLIQVIGYDSQVKMPPGGKLPEAEIAALTEWVKMGAPWPKESAASSAQSVGPKANLTNPTETDHWSFQPIADHIPPQVQTSAWIQTPIDNFILNSLESKGLEPAPRADKLTLLRRATFDLHGLPPTIQEINEFLADDRPGAFVRVVDRLLASPRYGETWGRHWLDVARYADSTGVDEDHPYVHSWRYRDYVIAAFNDDLPYDQFVREQIAGDLIPAADGTEINERGLIATGFLALGPKALAQRDTMKKIYDVVDEQIDTTSKAFLGLTIACARCHDHKFDPILTKDYYALASIFASTQTYDDVQESDSRFHLEPLVPREVADRYQAYQRQLQGMRLLARAITMSGVCHYLDQKLAPLVADYMTAAHSVYHDGAKAEDIARGGLDVGILNKWVDVLKSDNATPAYLEKWRTADAKAVRDVADEYQAEFSEANRKRRDVIELWIAKAEETLRQGKRPDFGELSSLASNPFWAAVTADEGPFGVPRDKREEVLLDPEKARLAALKDRTKALEDGAPPAPPMANAVVDKEEPIEQHVFIRGSYSNPGDVIGKQFPIVIAGEDQTAITDGSGRKELAEWLTRKDNPLPARVMVNRVWAWHFGDGIVRTPSNFGIRGDAPTHPELLDYLSRRFVEEGWSIKNLNRIIMLSRTYQMSSDVSDEALAKDPSNLLWSRFKRQRLTLEQLRDGFLALSGSLDSTLGGNTEPESANYNEEQRNNRRVDPDESRRRSVYLPLHRNKLPSLLNLFDFGDAATSAEMRGETNVAPQALYMLNSEFAYRSANALAERLSTDLLNRSDESKIERAYLMTLTRPPRGQELELARRFLANYRDKQTSASHADNAAWTALCQALMSSNEFNFVD